MEAFKNNYLINNNSQIPTEGTTPPPKIFKILSNSILFEETPISQPPRPEARLVQTQNNGHLKADNEPKKILSFLSFDVGIYMQTKYFQ